MIRFLLTAVGLPVLPAFLGLLSWAGPSASHVVWTPSQSAVWEIRAGQNAETEALKDRIESLQGRIDATNRKLAAAVAALEAQPR